MSATISTWLAGDAANQNDPALSGNRSPTREEFSSPRRRAAARLKPFIAIKSGRHEAAAKAAATHTGLRCRGPTGVVEATLRRAGVLRVEGARRSCSTPLETLAPLPPARGARASASSPMAVTPACWRWSTLMDRQGENWRNSRRRRWRCWAKRCRATWSKGQSVDHYRRRSAGEIRGPLCARWAGDPGVDCVMILTARRRLPRRWRQPMASQSSPTRA